MLYEEINGALHNLDNWNDTLQQTKDLNAKSMFGKSAMCSYLQIVLKYFENVLVTYI